MNREETLNWKVKAINYLILILVVAGLLTLVSCSKEEADPCKSCTTIVRYEPDTGGEYIEDDVTVENCNNPSNSTTTEHGTFEFKLWWLEKDTSITIVGNRTTAIRCK